MWKWMWSRHNISNLPSASILIWRTAPCWWGMNWLWGDDKAVSDLREGNHVLDWIPAPRLSSHHSASCCEPDEPATGGGHLQQGASGCYRQAAALPKLASPRMESGDCSWANPLFTPPPTPPLTHFPANGGINPCSVLWDGRSSLPTALHFIHHWTHTGRAGSMMVTAASASTMLEVVH